MYGTALPLRSTATTRPYTHAHGTHPWAAARARDGRRNTLRDGSDGHKHVNKRGKIGAGRHNPSPDHPPIPSPIFDSKIVALAPLLVALITAVVPQLTLRKHVRSTHLSVANVERVL